MATQVSTRTNEYGEEVRVTVKGSRITEELVRPPVAPPENQAVARIKALKAKGAIKNDQELYAAVQALVDYLSPGD